MSIEEKLKKQGSTFSKADGRDPQKYDGISRLENINVYDSNLDLNGIAPVSYDRQDRLSSSLTKSQLDLDGVAPKGPLSDPSYGVINDTFSKGTYRNNTPEGRSF